MIFYRPFDFVQDMDQWIILQRVGLSNFPPNRHQQFNNIRQLETLCKLIISFFRAFESLFQNQLSPAPSLRPPQDPYLYPQVHLRFFRYYSFCVCFATTASAFDLLLQLLLMAYQQPIWHIRTTQTTQKKILMFYIYHLIRTVQC